jgi:cytochrome c553
MRNLAAVVALGVLCVAATLTLGDQAENDPTEITPFATPDAAARAESLRAVGPPPAAVTAIIFHSSCGRCHGSDRPAVGLSLRRENFAAVMIDAPSREKPEYKLVDTENPDRSYLLMKLRGDEEIIGERMPIGSGPLPDHAIATIEAWIHEVSAAAAVAAADTAATAAPEATEAAGTGEEPEAPATSPPQAAGAEATEDAE